MPTEHHLTGTQTPSGHFRSSWVGVAPVTRQSAVSLRMARSLTDPTEWKRLETESRYNKQAIFGHLSGLLIHLLQFCSIAGQPPFKTSLLAILSLSPIMTKSYYISLAILKLLVWTRLAFNSPKYSCLILLSISYLRLLSPLPCSSAPRVQILAQRIRDVTSPTTTILVPDVYGVPTSISNNTKKKALWYNG